MARIFAKFLAVALSLSAPLAQSETVAGIPSCVRVMLSTHKPDLLHSPFNPVNIPPIQPQPGVSPGAAAVGQIIGILLARTVIERSGKEKIEARKAMDVGLERADANRYFSEQLQARLAAGQGLRWAPFETVPEPADLEQPGLLKRVVEANILTLESAFEWDDKSANLAIATRAKVWRKEGFAPALSLQFRHLASSSGSQNGMENGANPLLDMLREASDKTARFILDSSELGDALKRCDGTAPARSEGG